MNARLLVRLLRGGRLRFLHHTAGSQGSHHLTLLLSQICLRLTEHPNTMPASNVLSRSTSWSVCWRVKMCAVQTCGNDSVRCGCPDDVVYR